MFTTSLLHEWLSDPARQAATHERVVAFSNRWIQHPLYTDTERQLAAANGSFEAVLAVAHAFLERDADITALVDDLIAEAAGDPFFSPPFSAPRTDLSTGIVLFESSPLDITLNVINADALAAKKVANRGKGTIGFPGIVTVYRYLKSGNALLSLWEAPEAGSDFSAGTAAGPRMTGRRQMSDGEVWMIDGRRESFIIEHASSDIVQLQAQIKIDSAPLAVEYDVETGALAGATATDEVSSRVQMMVTLLRLMGRDDAVPLIEQFLTNQPFFTRWHLMREFLALNAEAALPHLRRLALEDPHEEVRDAARQTLETFFPDGDRGIA
ncbi:HEAT repeat domain-containing protein [Allosphingosinicella vermicomposti]|uniref:HEAT repeat domain-containing protein n=1 Tax=Allosphingosinicella vermicomposti TaxID=614671 RepID=UPI000D10B714|nr:HEAT repeat domain-containing protein [Allosphingosinicella vermicomposti]